MSLDYLVTPMQVESIGNSRPPSERDIASARLSAGQNSRGGSYSERSSSQAPDPEIENVVKVKRYWGIFTCQY